MGTELCGESVVPAPRHSLCKWGRGKQAPLNVSDPTYAPLTTWCLVLFNLLSSPSGPRDQAQSLSGSG